MPGARLNNIQSCLAILSLPHCKTAIGKALRDEIADLAVVLRHNDLCPRHSLPSLHEREWKAYVPLPLVSLEAACF